MDNIFIGFVLLFRSLLMWRWYKNANTLRVFIHLIIKANSEDHGFENRIIKRGQRVTSIQSLQQQLGLSRQQVRTALAHLVKTGEIVTERTNRNIIITIVNYASYQMVSSNNADFILFPKSLLKKQWYKCGNTFRIFVHLLLQACFRDQNSDEMTLMRGQLTTCLETLSDELGLDPHDIQAALLDLVAEGEVSIENHVSPSNLSSDDIRAEQIITVVHYDKYQTPPKKETRAQLAVNTPIASDQHADSNRSSCSQHQFNNADNANNETTKDVKGKKKAKSFSPPSRDDVEAYCQEEGLKIDTARFVDYYTSNGWMVGKNPMKDWRAAVRNWARGNTTNSSSSKKCLPAQDFPQRSYDNVPDQMMDELSDEVHAFIMGQRSEVTDQKCHSNLEAES